MTSKNLATPSAIGCFAISIIISCFLNLIYRDQASGHLIIETESVILLWLAVTGAVFAIWAMIEASGAFDEAKSVSDTLGTFKKDFKDILLDLKGFISQAEHSICIMVPTVYYGFLFGEETLASDLLQELQQKLEIIKRDLLAGRDSRFKIRIILFNDDLPQQYLKAANENKLRLEQYREGVKSILESISSIQKQYELKKVDDEKRPISMMILKNFDPHVRIFLRDAYPIYKESTARASISFAQNKLEDREEFESVGFSISRPEMVKAFVQLFQLFEQDSSKVKVDKKLIEKFCDFE